MKLLHIKYFFIIIFIVSFFSHVNNAFAIGTNPMFNGWVRSQTGAPVSGVTVRQTSNDRTEIGGSTPIVWRGGERTTTTNADGFFEFSPNSTFQCTTNPQYFDVLISNGHCDRIIDNPGNIDPYRLINIRCTVNPTTPTPVPSRAPFCNKPCTGPRDCEGAWDGCTVCAPTSTASGSAMTCQPPVATATPVPTAIPSPTPTPGPQCNSACIRAADCTGDAARNGCVACLPGAGGGTTCQVPPTPTPTPILMCNKSCTTSAECQRGVDGCPVCLPNDTGTGSTCRTTPACGTSCTKNSQCAGARNGCTTCNAGKCSAFSADMCKCDGMDFTVAGGGTTFFPGSDVTFIAFGKVEGADINIADLQSMQFSLYQSSLSNPNQSTRIAQSTAITPQVVSNTAQKVRYKVTWNQKIPATVPSGSLFRVQAEIKCVAKPGVLGATTSPTANYYGDILRNIQGIIANTKIVLGEATQNNQQATSFFPGAKISEKSCKIIKFYFE